MQKPTRWRAVACVICLNVSHHAGVDRGLLYITGDAGHKRIPVFKVGVKISLQKEGEKRELKWKYPNNWGWRWVAVAACVSVYLVHDRGGWGFDAWLLVREGQLLQQVHVGQGILQGHVGRHGNKASLTQHPSLREREDQRVRIWDMVQYRKSEDAKWE